MTSYFLTLVFWLCCYCVLVFIHMVACQQKDLIRNDNHAIMNHIQVIPIILFTIYVIIKQHSPTTGRLRQHLYRYLTKSNNQQQKQDKSSCILSFKNSFQQCLLPALHTKGCKRIYLCVKMGKKFRSKTREM